MDLMTRQTITLELTCEVSSVLYDLERHTDLPWLVRNEARRRAEQALWLVRANLEGRPLVPYADGRSW